MGRIVIEWDRESGRVDYRIEKMTHVEAQRVLMVVAMDCLDHALVEAYGHHHGKKGGRDDGHEFYGYLNRSECERGGL